MVLLLKAVFNVPARVIYEPFTSSTSMLRQGLGRPAVVDFRVGGPFRWFDNQVKGHFEEIEANRKLKMSLHLAEWPETEKSVSLTLEFNDWNGRTDTCELSVHIDDERNMVDLKRFWEQQFFDIWEKVFGYGRERFD